MRRFNPLAAIGGLVLLAAAAMPASAQDDPLGPLGPFLEEEAAEPWTLARTDDGYELLNTTDPNGVRYAWSPLTPAEQGTRTITAEVEIADGDNSSRVGILYGYQSDPLFYYLYVLQNDGSVALFRRSTGGFELVMSSQSDAVRIGVNTLEIREQGTRIEMFLNGESTGALEGTGTGEGAVGIAAVGTGRFVVHSYAESTGD